MRIPFIPPIGCCSRCGRAIEGHEGEYLCLDCERNKPFFDRAASAFRFEGAARELLLGYKFNAHLWLKDDLSDWLEACIRAHFAAPSVDLILPMPLTLFHRIDRGYNQSAYLAEEVARRIGRKCRDDILKRTGRPKRQAGLDEEERRQNVKGTIAVRRPEFVRGRTILLIDDVMTTGSTLSEAARVLKLAGAWRIWCATLARSIRS